jgi:hypothetical protein
MTATEQKGSCRTAIYWLSKRGPCGCTYRLWTRTHWKREKDTSGFRSNVIQSEQDKETQRERERERERDTGHDNLDMATKL